MCGGGTGVLLTILLDGKFPYLNPESFRLSHLTGFVSHSRTRVTQRLELIGIKTLS